MQTRAATLDKAAVIAFELVAAKRGTTFSAMTQKKRSDQPGRTLVVIFKARLTLEVTQNQS